MRFCAAYLGFILLVMGMSVAYSWPKQQGRKRDVERVSYQECNLEEGRRENCGYYGIDEFTCYSRECCWGESDTPGIPWCYHSIPTMQPKCVINDPERVECGEFGIRKESCLYQGCCWKPASDSGTPWCYHKERVPIVEGECGLPAISPNVMTRIVGGVEAVPHSWPWMVSLQINGRHFCGGSLINEQWVMSAAHCEPSRSWGELTVVVGMHSRSSVDHPELSVGVEEIVPHEEYDPIDKDVMLLKLAEPVELNDYVSPVCLAQPGDYTPGVYCYTSGWGTTQFGDRDLPDVLQQVRVPLMNRTLCNHEEWYDGEITQSMVCAGYEEGGRDSCQGDSGGPLVCYSQERENWELIGVVSWGYACASENKPGVYSNVGMFVDWVEDKINEYK